VHRSWATTAFHAIAAASLLLSSLPSVTLAQTAPPSPTVTATAPLAPTTTPTPVPTATGILPTPAASPIVTVTATVSPTPAASPTAAPIPTATPVAGPGVDQVIIGPEGGVLTSANGRLTLQFPPGAVPRNTIIRHTPAPRGINGTFFYYFDLTAQEVTSGVAVTRFAQPLTVTVSYTADEIAQLDEAALRLFYMDVNTTHWVQIPGLVHNACAPGRNGSQQRLRSLGDDPDTPRDLRGWIKQEENAIEAGTRTSIRRPPGYQLAHKRGFEAKYGFDYEYSDLQLAELHRLQHAVEGY
jgi:hypothetical protein